MKIITDCNGELSENYNEEDYQNLLHETIVVIESSRVKIAKQINTLPNVDKSDSQNAPSHRYCQMLWSVAPMDGNTNSLPTCKNIKCHTSSINAMDASGYNMGVSFLKRDCFI